jgi:hypothetical protein
MYLFWKKVIKIAFICKNISTFARRKLTTIKIGLKTNMKNLKISMAILVASTRGFHCALCLFESLVILL